MLTSIAFIVILLYIIFAKTAAAESKQKKKNTLKAVKDRMVVKRPKHDICRAANVNTSRLGVLCLEDRENDWLARQLKEEARLKKKMFGEIEG